MYLQRTPGTNPYFNNFTNANEQDLLESLIIESIKMWGCDMFYLPRSLDSYDPLYGESAVSSYNQAIPIEMYIKSVDGFSGDGTFLSKFGLEIRDQVTFTVARKTFETNVTSIKSDVVRPNEGDLIYFPLNHKLFQIQYTDYLKEGFYALGALQSYDLTCELFEYSNENMNTGIAEIDQIQTDFSTNVFDFEIVDSAGDNYYLVDENGNPIIDENYIANIGGDNNTFIDEEQDWTPSTHSDDVIDWSELDPFSEGYGGI
jgi:hypothetical protein